MAAGRTIARNSVFLGLAFGISKLFSITLTAIAGRVLGPAVYGIYGTGATLVEVGRIVSSVGLDFLVTREIATAPDRADRIATHAAAVKVLAGVVVYLALIGVVLVFDYPRAVLVVVMVLGTAVFLENLSDIFDAVFQGVQRMWVTTIAFVASAAFLLASGAAALLGGLGLRGFVLCFAASFTLRWIIMVIAGRRMGVVQLRTAMLERKELGRLTRAGSLLLGATVVAVVFHRMDILMLSRMVPDVEVGLYFGAVRIVDVTVLLPRILATAVYPALRRRHDDGRQAAVSLLEESTRISLVLCSAVALVVWWLAPTALQWILGEDFVGAGGALRLLAWGIVFQGGAHMLARLLLAIDAERDFLGVAALSLVCNFGLNLVLIPRYGIEGAAWATLASYAVNVAFYVRAAWKRGYRLGVGNSLFGPLAATFAAAVVGMLWKGDAVLLRAATMAVVWIVVLVVGRGVRPSDVAWLRRLARREELG